MNTSRNELNIWIKLSVLPISILLYVLCFHHLDWLSVQHWDEGLFAMRAVYLAKTGSILESFSEFPLMGNNSNTKPPLFTLIQAFLLKHMDNYLLALRLPSAIAQLLLAAVLFWVAKIQFKNYWIGILACLIFLLTKGLYVGHLARFGDQDMPFILLLFLSIYFMFSYIESDKKTDIFFSLLFFFCSYYTKSVLAYVMFPGVVLYVVLNLKFHLFSKVRNYFYGLLFLVPISISYFTSDSHHGNASRLFIAKDHYHEWYHYLELFINESYLMPWFFFFIIAIILSFFVKKSFLNYLAIQGITILFILSMAEMRLHHYISIVYPIIAVASAYALFTIVHGFYKALPITNMDVKKAVVALSLSILFLFPLKEIIPYTITPEEIHDEHLFGEMLDRMHRSDTAEKDITVVSNYPPISISFYKYLFEWKYGYTMKVNSNLNKEYPLNTVVMFHKEEAPDFINCYELEIIKSSNKIILAKLKGRI